MAISKNEFFPEILFSKYTDSELRKEYSRLRSIARKRLERMGKSEFADTKTYLKNRNRFKQVKDIKNKTELSKMLADVYDFVSSKRSRITGLKEIRRESVETLHSHGYNFVTKENWKVFTDFMDDFQDQFARSYGSPTSDELNKWLGSELSKHRIPPDVLKNLFDQYLTERALKPAQ